MTHFLHSDADLQAGLARLIAADPRLVAGRRESRRLQPAPARGRLSPASAPSSAASNCRPRAPPRSAIGLFAAFDPFHHDSVRRARTDKLKRLGLSAPKIKSIREIGKAVAQGRIDLTAVGEMDADAAHAALVALHGIGPWSADIYLLFCLGHSDAFPAGDLAVQEAARIAFGLRKRPDAKALAKLAEAWRPWRGVAAHLLWAYYHAVKKRDVVPVQSAGNGEEAGQEEAEEEKIHKEIRQWLNSTARGWRRARARRSNSSCSCTATAPTATT